MRSDDAAIHPERGVQRANFEPARNTKRLAVREFARLTAMQTAANNKAKPAFIKNTVAPVPLLNARSSSETPSDPRMADAGSVSLAEAGALSVETNPTSVIAAGTAV
jgi:hypothetical protein